MGRKNGFLLLWAVVFAALFIFSGFMLGRRFAAQKQSENAFDAAESLVKEAPPKEEETEAEPPAEETAYEKYAAVYEENSDFAGWLKIPGTNIDYPVMQSAGDPNFYLKHAFDGSYSEFGVPYIQENCDVELSDNVIIYGHNMKDGSMFSDLCEYESEDFYREHSSFTFDTLSGFGEYEIVAVFKTVAYSESGFEYNRFVEAENEAAFDEFLASCRALALYETGVTAEYGDRLLTLSTCEYSQTDGRMVIVAKKVN